VSCAASHSLALSGKACCSRRCRPEGTGCTLMLSFCHQPSKEGVCGGRSMLPACMYKCQMQVWLHAQPWSQMRTASANVVSCVLPAGCASSRATSRRWMSSRRCQCCARTTTSPTSMCPPRRCAAVTLLRRLLRMRSFTSVDMLHGISTKWCNSICHRSTCLLPAAHA